MNNKKENVFKDKSFAFAVRIVNLYKFLCEADFSIKISIADLTKKQKKLITG